ncbi:hypothetical protein [Hyphomicrobium sp. 802]|uniref:DUF7768 domain-containing protein n=1 Tax=Hyphomicrobium sp. 802 TaxID=1112272 RepID=UPI0004B10DAE|nr:hypothetical protein [Hyphomicrobium sp. 802]
MRLVIVETPYAGDIEANVTYARLAMRDSIERGEAPFASHLLYTQPGILRDEKPAERALGIAAGFAWGRNADATIVYVDRGISPGMKQGIKDAEAAGRPVEYRCVKADLLPLPEIAPCPKCGSNKDQYIFVVRSPTPHVPFRGVGCANEGCDYAGPRGQSLREAIEAHNAGVKPV